MNSNFSLPKKVLVISKMPSRPKAHTGLCNLLMGLRKRALNGVLLRIITELMRFAFTPKLAQGFPYHPVATTLPTAIAFNEGTVKHIYYRRNQRNHGSLNLRPIEQAKIACAKRLFNQLSTSKVKYHDVDSYQTLLNIMGKV